MVDDEGPQRVQVPTSHFAASERAECIGAAARTEGFSGRMSQAWQTAFRDVTSSGAATPVNISLFRTASRHSIPGGGELVPYASTSPFDRYAGVASATASDIRTAIGANERGGIGIHHYEPAVVPGIVGSGRL
ncbi:hypothetical protein ACW9HQ_42350 [Nocardia gipuzkoensis]